MLSFEILCAQEGQLNKENFGISKLITSLYPMDRGDETYLPASGHRVCNVCFLG
jgi:hypothetical protein